MKDKFKQMQRENDCDANDDAIADYARELGSSLVKTINQHIKRFNDELQYEDQEAKERLMQSCLNAIGGQFAITEPTPEKGFELLKRLEFHADAFTIETHNWGGEAEEPELIKSTSDSIYTLNI